MRKRDKGDIYKQEHSSVRMSSAMWARQSSSVQAKADSLGFRHSCRPPRARWPSRYRQIGQDSKTVMQDAPRPSPALRQHPLYQALTVSSQGTRRERGQKMLKVGGTDARPKAEAAELSAGQSEKSRSCFAVTHPQHATRGVSSMKVSEMISGLSCGSFETRTRRTSNIPG